MKWQDYTKYTIGGTISLLGILFVILNLQGISYSDDGNKTCTDCYSKIEVNSTYWNVCTEHAGNKTALFKKTPTSRVIYMNLDKINEIITTDPSIKTYLLVSTIKSRAEFDSEYGYLRKAKDGDCIIERINKPSKFYIHGNKLPSQIVKWSFNADSIFMEEINIDPVWLGVVEKEFTNTTINGYLDLYSIRIENNKWVYGNIISVEFIQNNSNVSLNISIINDIVLLNLSNLEKKDKLIHFGFNINRTDNIEINGSKCINGNCKIYSCEDYCKLNKENNIIVIDERFIIDYTGLTLDNYNFNNDFQVFFIPINISQNKHYDTEIKTK